jgi:hypothetical protein
MSLECYKKINTILARDVHKYDHSNYDPQEIFKKHIMVDPVRGVIQFKIQDGPRLEGGDNGVDVDEIICFCRDVVRSFNDKFPCVQNESVMVDLCSSLGHLDDRREDRRRRSVEGFDKE